MTNPTEQANAIIPRNGKELVEPETTKAEEQTQKGGGEYEIPMRHSKGVGGKKKQFHICDIFCL